MPARAGGHRRRPARAARRAEPGRHEDARRARPRARPADGPRPTPPPRPSTRSRRVAPSSKPPRARAGVSCPERPKHLMPCPRPSPVHQAAPRPTMSGTAKSVSTLLITVGRPQSPASTGNGGLARGMARRPSSDSISAVSSPRTKPPAPRRTSTSTEKSLPSTCRLTRPQRRASSTARVEAPRGESWPRRGRRGRPWLAARRVGGEERAFEQPMRIALDQVAVLEDAGLALLAVDHEVLGLSPLARRAPSHLTAAGK